MLCAPWNLEIIHALVKTFWAGGYVRGSTSVRQWGRSAPAHWNTMASITDIKFTSVRTGSTVKGRTRSRSHVKSPLNYGRAPRQKSQLLMHSTRIIFISARPNLPLHIHVIFKSLTTYISHIPHSHHHLQPYIWIFSFIHFRIYMRSKHVPILCPKGVRRWFTILWLMKFFVWEKNRNKQHPYHFWKRLRKSNNLEN